MISLDSFRCATRPAFEKELVMPRVSSLITCLVLTLGLATTTLNGAVSPRLGFQKIVVRYSPGASASSIEQATALAGAAVVDQTSDSLVAYCPVAATAGLVRALNRLADVVEVRDDLDLIKFAVSPIDTRVGNPGNPTTGSRSGPLPAPARDAFVIQFSAPPHQEWIAQITAAGVQIVDYIPENAYVVLATSDMVASLDQLLPLQYSGLHQPYRKISPEVSSLTTPFADIVVSILSVPEAADPLALMAANTIQAFSAPEDVGDRTLYRVTVPTALVSQLAQLPAVTWIEAFHNIDVSGEREAHLIAGDTMATTSSPFKPVLPGSYCCGATSWIVQKGVSNYTTAVKVGTLDTGFDTPTPPASFKDFLSHTNQPFVSVVNDTVNASATTADCYGHGTMVAGILAGNAGDTYSTNVKDIGANYGDANYLMGQGVAPGVPLTVGKVLDYDTPCVGILCPKAWSSILGGFAASGISIVNASFNYYIDNSYRTDSQTFDKIVRHANGTDTGSPIALFVSTGNTDLTSNVNVLAPANAKNVVAVGATESYNPIPGPTPYPLPYFSNGLPIDMTGQDANNGWDIWRHSLKGPTPDGRNKPDVVAPGTAVEAPKTRDSFYNTTSCASSPDRIGGLIDTLDANQEHLWSRGTSFAAPAATGAGVLLATWFKNKTGALPSPATLKALEIAFATDLYPGGRSPSPSVAHSPDVYQGWGKVDLTNAFKTDGRYFWTDQDPALVILPGSLGWQPQTPWTIKNTSRLVTIVLVWTDYPGATGTQKELVNDLDLQVCPAGTCRGTQLRGNVFDSNGHSKVMSTLGGPLPFDHVNNVEVVRFTSAEIGATTFSIDVLFTQLIQNCFKVWTPDPAHPQQDFAVFIDNVVGQ